MQQIIVIGGGLSGLATAFYLQQQANAQNLSVNITVLEKESRLGGKIWSRKEAGYLCEWGPNGFLSNKPHTLDLCQSLGITARLLLSNDNARKRFIFSKRKLHKLPHTQVEFLRSSLLSLGGKLRIAAEFFVPKGRSNADESLADFTYRRLGHEALNKLIAPMAGGIFAGDPKRMSLQACFPRIYQLEQEYGGLIKAMRQLALKGAHKPSSAKSAASPAGAGGVLTSFTSGIEELIIALSAAIGTKNIVRTASVESVVPAIGGGWQVTAGNQVYFANKVICATPAFASATMLEELDSNLATKLRQINYSPLVVACLGYATNKIQHDLNGFGYLFARGEEQHILGTLWDSSIFAKRAPEGKILFRSMLGGARHPQVMNLTDAQIRQLVQTSLARTMGINSEPELVQIYRHPQAIPEYRLGHKILIADIMHQIAQYDGLFLTGNAYFGVGINDCVAAAQTIAEEVLASIKCAS